MFTQINKPLIKINYHNMGLRFIIRVFPPRPIGFVIIKIDVFVEEVIV